ncbi:MAG: glycosyltransferase [Akkermansiaceae bacterium]
MSGGGQSRLRVDGKFFRAGRECVFLKMVTYGPFPTPRPADLADDREQLQKIAHAGFNAVRLYEVPDLAFLDAAREAGLYVFVGLNWEYHHDFISGASRLSRAHMMVKDGLEQWGSHPAVAGVFVANEIPSDMVRWMGVTRVRRALEELIQLGKGICPDLLFAYANYPTTEYLEPANADFTAMNIYLENREDFAAYLPRLHNIAGDRPVLLSEFGLDTRRNNMGMQSESLLWYVDESLDAGIAGITVYAWSDHWFRGDREVEDWDFGLIDRKGAPKASLPALSERLGSVSAPTDGIALADPPSFSVVVCSYNGGSRIKSCLRALKNLDYPDYEILVVDDGSSDNTTEVVKDIEGVRLIQARHAGLSAARNRAAREASGEIIAYTDDDCQPHRTWLQWLAHAFMRNGWDACGGPNLPPSPESIDHAAGGLIDEVVVASAPGAPSHVLSGDVEAEHLPGCNLAVRKSVWQAVGGFAEHYRIAGDDVDFCWRLQEAGFRMGFCAAAFVWHRRRTKLWGYFKQQYQYGKAEALLMRDYPEKFHRGSGAVWKGCVYSGGVMTADTGSFIYHGKMGTAPYQQLVTHMQPLRPIPRKFDCLEARIKLALAKSVQPLLRAWARQGHSIGWQGLSRHNAPASDFIFIDSMHHYEDYEARWWCEGFIGREAILNAIIKDGWEPLENDSDWDCQRGGLRVLIAIEAHARGSQVLTRMEMSSRSQGRMPADFVRRLESLGISRDINPCG